MSNQSGINTRQVHGTQKILARGREDPGGAEDDAARIGRLRGRFPGQLGATISPKVHAITTADYPTKAKRPADGRLDNGKLARVFGVALPPWEAGLSQIMR